VASVQAAPSRADAERGQAGAKRIRRYDFSQPEALDPNQLRPLRALLVNFANRAGRLLSGRFRVAIRIEAQELEQRSWLDVMREVEDPSYIAVFGLNPLPGRGIFCLPIGLAMAWVDLAFGGRGDGNYPARALSEVESAVVTRYARNLLDELASVLSAAGQALQASFGSEASSPILVQVSSATDLNLVCPLQVSVAETSSYQALLLLPLLMLKPLLPALANEEPAGTLENEGPLHQVVERLLATPVELSVRFPPVSLTPAELAQLRGGEVIPLGLDAGEPLLLAVGDLVRGSVIPGRRGKRLVCTVVELFREVRSLTTAAQPQANQQKELEGDK